MSNYEKILSHSEVKDGGNGFKVIEVNMSDTADSLYAVCTPVKLQ
ncbi:hypothetical protein [Oceanobacillus halophilus]|nr:hypothetical protein [Oceanobacillus halophilus]